MFRIFAFLAVLIVGEPAHSWSLPTPYSWTYSVSSNVKSFRLKGIDGSLNIPESYIDTPRRYRVKNDVNDLLLHGLLPDFVGRSKDNVKEFEEAINFNRLSVYIRSTDRTVLDDFARIYAGHNSRLREVQLGTRYGLQAVQQVPPSSGNWDWKLLYRDRWESPSVAISCFGQGTVPVPLCTHLFFYEKAFVKVTYHSSNISSWSIIQQVIISRLNEWKAE